MAIRAKFRVDNIERRLVTVYRTNAHGDYGPVEETGGIVTLHPVVGGTRENDEYYAATPGGEIRLEILNEAATAEFFGGKSYTVTFELDD